MNPILARSRSRLLGALIALAILAPAALAAAQYPKYWLWIAPELTPMTWLQTVLLMLSAAASLAVAVAGKVRGWSRSRIWPHTALAVGFTYLALDDRFAVHERIRDRYLAPHNVRIPGLNWLAPGDFQMLLIAVAGLIVLPFVLRTLRGDRMALVLFVLGVVTAAVAIGMDTIDPTTMPVDVERLEQTLEECVELLADSFFFAALGARLLGLLDAPAAPAVIEAASPEAADDADTAIDLPPAAAPAGGATRLDGSPTEEVPAGSDRMEFAGGAAR